MMMEISWISILFGAFGLGVLQLTWETVKFFISRKDKVRDAQHIFDERQREVENLFNDLISGAVKIQELIEDFIVNNNAARILLLKLENGGGVPQLGTIQHISVLNEAIHPNLKYPPNNIVPIKQDFQDYVIDADYQRVLMHMLTDKLVVLNTREMEEGLLKKIYEVNKVEKSVFSPVTQIPSIGEKSFKGFMIYMSIEFIDERLFDAKIESDYIILQTKIKQIFYEFYVKRIAIFD